MPGEKSGNNSERDLPNRQPHGGQDTDSPDSLASLTEELSASGPEDRTAEQPVDTDPPSREPPARGEGDDGAEEADEANPQLDEAIAHLTSESDDEGAREPEKPTEPVKPAEPAKEPEKAAVEDPPPEPEQSGEDDIPDLSPEDRKALKAKTAEQFDKLREKLTEARTQYRESEPDIQSGKVVRQLIDQGLTTDDLNTLHDFGLVLNQDPVQGAKMGFQILAHVARAKGVDLSELARLAGEAGIPVAAAPAQPSDPAPIKDADLPDDLREQVDLGLSIEDARVIARHRAGAQKAPQPEPQKQTAQPPVQPTPSAPPAPAARLPAAPSADELSADRQIREFLVGKGVTTTEVPGLWEQEVVPAMRAKAAALGVELNSLKPNAWVELVKDVWPQTERARRNGTRPPAPTQPEGKPLSQSRAGGTGRRPPVTDEDLAIDEAMSVLTGG
jgi:hypothetical protein